MNLDAAPPSDNLRKFIARCEARAILWQLGDVDLYDAVDELERLSRQFGIAPDTAQAILARVFAAARDDLGGWRP